MDRGTAGVGITEQRRCREVPASQVDGQELSTVQEQSDTQSGDKAGGVFCGIPPRAVFVFLCQE